MTRGRTNRVYESLRPYARPAQFGEEVAGNANFRDNVVVLIGLRANPQSFMERQHTKKADFKRTRVVVLLVTIGGKDRGS